MQTTKCEMCVFLCTKLGRDRVYGDEKRGFERKKKLNRICDNRCNSALCVSFSKKYEMRYNVCWACEIAQAKQELETITKCCFDMHRRSHDDMYVVHMRTVHISYRICGDTTNRLVVSPFLELWTMHKALPSFHVDKSWTECVRANSIECFAAWNQSKMIHGAIISNILNQNFKTNDCNVEQEPDYLAKREK